MHTNIENVCFKVGTVLGSMEKTFSFKKPLVNSWLRTFRFPAMIERKPVPFGKHSIVPVGFLLTLSKKRGYEKKIRLAIPGFVQGPLSAFTLYALWILTTSSKKSKQKFVIFAAGRLFLKAQVCQAANLPSVVMSHYMCKKRARYKNMRKGSVDISWSLICKENIFFL